MRYPKLFLVPLFAAAALMSAAAASAAPVTGTYSTGGDPFNQAMPAGAVPPYHMTATASTYSYVLYTPDQAFTFGDLTSLSANFVSNTGGGGGTPRLTVQLDTNHDMTADGSIVIHLGTSPGFADSAAVLNTYSGFNVIGNEDTGRYDLAALGGSGYTNYSAALAMLGAADVLRFAFVADTFAPFEDRDLMLFSIDAEANVAGNEVPEPATGALLLAGLTALGLRRRKQG